VAGRVCIDYELGELAADRVYCHQSVGSLVRVHPDDHHDWSPPIGVTWHHVTGHRIVLLAVMTLSTSTQVEVSRGGPSSGRMKKAADPLDPTTEENPGREHPPKPSSSLGRKRPASPRRPVITTVSDVDLALKPYTPGSGRMPPPLQGRDREIEAFDPLVGPAKPAATTGK